MTYGRARETFRFASRNEHSFWPFFGFIMGRSATARPLPLVGSKLQDEGLAAASRETMAPQVIEIAQNGLGQIAACNRRE
jgi:hypothetical protein